MPDDKACEVKPQQLGRGGYSLRMGFGEHLRVTLFGESHGIGVGALVEGLPSGLEVDEQAIQTALSRRSPGGSLASARREEDRCEILSGIHQGRTTGWPVLLFVRNTDAHSSDYSFLPHHPRPGHADLPVMERTGGHADSRGGGSTSGRLTVGIVAAAALCGSLMDSWGWKVESHTSSIGEITAKPLADCPPPDGADWERTRCRDPEAAARMVSLVEELRQQSDSIGSSVEMRISSLPIGLGEPWYDGLEPALARALMAIPAARAVEFGRGVQAAKMRGSEHNDAWQNTDAGPRPQGDDADGSLGGFSTGAPLQLKVIFKPPSSIGKEQVTLNLESGEQESLTIVGRHDPVIAPRAVAVVEATGILVVCDLALRGGWRA